MWAAEVRLYVVTRRFTADDRVIVTGCADIVAPEHAWLERRGDTVQVACNHTSERWHLVCKGVQWIGAFGNCTPAGPINSGTDSSRVHLGQYYNNNL